MATGSGSIAALGTISPGASPDCRDPGAAALPQAYKLGLEGIVSKRKDSSYRSGRSPHWIKSNDNGNRT
jgi:ATP-dependent DNA ligase